MRESLPSISASVRVVEVIRIIDEDVLISSRAQDEMLVDGVQLSSAALEVNEADEGSSAHGLYVNLL